MVNAEMVAAAIRTLFAQQDADHVHEQLDMLANRLGRQGPKLELESVAMGVGGTAALPSTARAVRPAQRLCR